MKTSKTISVTLPSAMLSRAATLARKENLTISELVREALRRYDRQFWWDEVNGYGRAKAREQGITENDVDRMIHEYRQSNRETK